MLLKLKVRDLLLEFSNHGLWVCFEVCHLRLRSRYKSKQLAFRGKPLDLFRVRAGGLRFDDNALQLVNVIATARSVQITLFLHIICHQDWIGLPSLFVDSRDRLVDQLMIHGSKVGCSEVDIDENLRSNHA